MYIVDKVVKTLFEQAHTMQSIYQMTHRFFGKRVFAERLTADGVQRMRFGEMDRITRRYAAYAEQHFRGRYVGLYAKNSERWICAFWGLLMAGYVPVLLNTSIAPAAVLSVVADFGIEYVVTDRDYALFEGVDGLTATAFDRMDAAPEQAPEARWCDLFAVSTSGTEGAPKSYLFNGEAMCQQILISQEVLSTAPAFSCYGRKNAIKVMAFLPFYHIFGLVTLVLWFSFFGRTLVFPLDDSPRELQRACREAGVTHFFAVPLVWNTIVNKLKAEVAAKGLSDKFAEGVEKSLALQKMFPRFGQWVAKNVIFKQITDKLFGRSLVLGISGGAYCSAETLRLTNALGYNLLNGYGSTEAAIVSVNVSPNVRDRILPNCGKIFGSIDYSVDDETGELVLNGSTLYYAQMVDGRPVPRDGAPVHTRDFGTVDEARNLTLLGRLDEIMIGPNGENLAPDAIEYHYRNLGTDDYCVLALDGKLVLVINRQTLAVEAEDMRAVIAAANKSVPLIERVHEVRLVDYPCRTAIGKANRRALIEGFRDERIAYTTLAEGAKRQADDALTVAVRRAVADVLKIDPAEIDDSDDFFANLGGNSLQYFELMSGISAAHQVQMSYGEALPTTVGEMAERLRGSVGGDR